MNPFLITSCKAANRVNKKVSNSLTLTTGTPATYNWFIYDGWNLLAELDGNNTNAIVRSYIWGSDLSGSMQGAGGVGGLLMINDPTTVATHFVAYDGNGNVAATVSGSAGTTTATYEYGPFGEPIRSSGTISKTNPYRFSTKYQDNESDLVYCGFRFYSQSTGRWLDKDPLEEKGGRNFYAFVRNAALRRVDAFGLEGYVGDGEPLTCRLARTYEFLPPSELGRSRFVNEPFSTYVDSFIGGQADLMDISPFDAEGRCCYGKCLSSVVISAHDRGGAADFPNSIAPTTLFNY